MRILTCFLVGLCQVSALGNGFNSFCGTSFCAPRRIVSQSYSAPVYQKSYAVKEVIREREVPVLVYPVANYQQPNQHLQQAQFKQYMNQLQRMQDWIETYSEQSQTTQVQQQVQVPQQHYQPPVQQYGQAYTQQPQPYGAYTPQPYVQQPQPQQPQIPANQCGTCSEVLRALLGAANGQHSYQLQGQQGQPYYGQQIAAMQPHSQESPSVVSGRCLECHSGANPKGGLDLTLLAQMDFQKRFAAFQRARNGEMPPPSANKPPLSNQELGLLFNEIISPEEAGQLLNKQGVETPEAIPAEPNGAY